ncbi:MAG: GNAT family N-acetyltransferase [Pleomorphochaeta sp.]
MFKIINNIIETDRLFLRGFLESDAQAVYDYAKDDETVKYLTWASHKSVEESRQCIVNFLTKTGAYAITLKSTKQVIGCIDVQKEENKATFGYVLNKKYWNKGYMSEALEAIINFSFIKLEVSEVFGLYEIGNEASMKVMEKCNMKWSHTEKNKIINNKVADYECYIIKKSDWEK